MKIFNVLLVTCVQKNVLGVVSINVWRRFIKCQIFSERGGIEGKNGSARPSVRGSETVERVEIIYYD
jgi:hypothetical protein